VATEPPPTFGERMADILEPALTAMTAAGASPAQIEAHFMFVAAAIHANAGGSSATLVRLTLAAFERARSSRSGKGAPDAK
jgi:uncharacterized MAPEG superfamily protein